MSVTDEDIKNVIVALDKTFTSELMGKSEAELEGYWHFKYSSDATAERNLYNFFSKLELYKGFCRRWEESKNGSCCVVERVRDKYLMPKIKAFAKQITSHYDEAEEAG